MLEKPVSHLSTTKESNCHYTQCQQLSSRFAVVVCGQSKEEHGTINVPNLSEKLVDDGYHSLVTGQSAGISYL